LFAPGVPTPTLGIRVSTFGWGKRNYGGIEMGSMWMKKISHFDEIMRLDEIIDISEIENTNDLCCT
jgi:hypothetical protein